MNVKEKLEFLSSASDFVIIKNDDKYKVTLIKREYDICPLVAFVYTNGNIIYTMKDVYHNNCNYTEINTKALDKLKSFCEMLVRED